MKSLKLAIAVLIALVGAFFLMKLIGIAYSILWVIVKFTIVLVIALPIFFIVKKKLLK